MEETEFYESKFITSATCVSKDFQESSSNASSDISSSNASSDISSSNASSSNASSSNASSDISYYYNKKCSPSDNTTIVNTSNEPEESKLLLDSVSVTVPYEINTNHGYPTRGSLVFVDYEGLVRPLYRVPQNFSLDKFVGSRFIAASSAMGKFNVIRTSGRTVLDDVNTTSTVLEQLGTDNKFTTLPSTSDSNNNFALDSKLNISYMVGNDEIHAVRANGVKFLSRKLPPSNKTAVQVVAIGPNESAFTAAKVGNIQDITIPNVIGTPVSTINLPRDFKDLGLKTNIGYILHMSINGVINRLLLIEAKEIVFRGMYFFNDRLVVTGSYEGQMSIALSHSAPKFTNIATKMPGTTSFILAFDSLMNLIWYRLITSDNAKYNIIGDVTINKEGTVFTTCRFKGNLALSDYNSIEIDKRVESSTEAMVLISLSGEIKGCKSRTISEWRVLPVSLPQASISDYVSMTNNGYDIFISAYTNASLSKAYMVSDHYFIAGFTPQLVDLFYHPIKNSMNKYNSRILAYSKSTLFTGSTTWNDFYVYPFGLLSESLIQSGYFLNISLRSPKLIGIVVDRYDNKVDVQFKGYTNVYIDAKVGRDYYVDLPLTTETSAALTPNMNNLNEAIYFGTAIKNGIILIS